MGSATERLSIEPVDGSVAAAELPRQGRLVIGAARDKADYVVAGAGVDAVHCAIGRLRSGGWAVKDLGSSGGTRVNGERTTTARIRAGDEIECGDVLLRVFEPSVQLAEPEPPAASEAVHAQPRAKAKRARGAGGAPSIPGYKVTGSIGQGGMGRVYLAVQESLDRKVALKVLSPRLAADHDFVEHFQAEARAAAALNHPNIVTVYDVGEADGVHYLSMEYMARGCLESRVSKQGPLPWAEVLKILKDAAAGLVYAESRGIVHRDIKPANLMQNDAGATKIADLGLAAQAEMERSERGSDRLLGTPHFIAPELIRAERPDGRSDLYSLGATAYRLLSGQTPFEGATARDIVRAALREEPRPLSELVPQVPAALSDIVHQLLSKDPADRPPGAAMVVADLARIEGGSGERVASGGGAKLGLALVAIAAVAAGAVWFGGGLGGAAEAGAHDATTLEQTTDEGSDALPANLAFEGSEPDDEPSPMADDTELKLFETQAELAFLQLKERNLADQERIAELRRLAGEYMGSDAATAALAAADALESQLASEFELDRARTRQVEEVLAALFAAAVLDDPNDAREVLAAMRAVPGQAELEDVGEFVRRRAALEQDVIGGATEYLVSGEGRADRLLESGEFEGARTTLTELSLFQLPDLPEDAPPAELVELHAVHARIVERLNGLDASRETFLERARELDRQRLDARLGGSSGLEHDLRTFDFDGALERLQTLESELRTPAARELAARWHGELEQAAAVLRVLGDAWQTEGWRRKAIFDPRVDRHVRREAVNANSDGILLAEGGGTERIPWSAWAGRTSSLHQLFSERLDREWTPAERRGIATLLRASVVVETLARLQPVLGRDSTSMLTDVDAREIMELFDWPARWSEDDESLRLLEEERAATRLLLDALRAESDGSYSIAILNLERLRARRGESLLVTTLGDTLSATSDGDGED